MKTLIHKNLNLFLPREIFWRFVLVSLLLSVSPALTQSNIGTTIGDFLLIEPSAHYAGMGNAGAASFDEIGAGFYNPAAVGRLDGHGVQLTHSDWLVGIKYDYVIGLVNLGNTGNLFFSLTSLNSGEMDVRTVAQPLGTGQKFDVSDLALGIGFSRRMTNRFSMGLQINYISETIFHSTWSTVALNVGTLFELTQNGLVLGASLSNYGLPAGFSGRDLRIQYDLDPDKYGDNSGLPGTVVTGEFPLPVLFRVGLSYPLQIGHNNRVLLAVNAFHPNNNDESLSVGGEWQLYRSVALRAGYQNLFLDKSETGLTLGAGFKMQIAGYDLKFDYAWADYNRLLYAQRFTLGLLF